LGTDLESCVSSTQDAVSVCALYGHMLHGTAIAMS